VEKSLRKYFGKRSEQVVQDNLLCVRRGFEEVLEIPRAVIEGADKVVATNGNGKVVRDVMQDQIFACRPTTSLAKVAQTMSDQNVGAVVVVDKDGHLQGVLSSTDLVRARNTNGHYANLPDLAPEQIMTRNVITVTANEPLSAAINKLIENRIDRLVVVQRENGHQTPVGMLSMADLARLAT